MSFYEAIINFQYFSCVVIKQLSKQIISNYRVFIPVSSGTEITKTGQEICEL